jgi:hypothetical protein
MQITAEEITIVPQGASRELLIVLGGHRIVLTREAADAVVARLGSAVAALDRLPVAAHPAPRASIPPVRARGVTEGGAVLDSLRRLTQATTAPAG